MTKAQTTYNKMVAEYKNLMTMGNEIDLVVLKNTMNNNLAKTVKEFTQKQFRLINLDCKFEIITKEEAQIRNLINTRIIATCELKIKELAE